MTRIDAFKKWIADGYWTHWEDGYIQFPGDIEVLKSNIPEIKDLTAAQIDDLYSDFSTVGYCAGWLTIYEGGRDFREWLLSYPNEAGTKFCDHGMAEWYVYFDMYNEETKFSLKGFRK